MNNKEDLSDQLLSERINQAIDVSATFDNCLFNALALYFLSNQLEFPADFFVPFPSLDSEEVIQLKTFFPDIASLSFFEHYRKQHDKSNDPCLVEKVMVLGIFFRKWCVRNLLENKQHRDNLFDGTHHASPENFLSMLESYQQDKESRKIRKPWETDELIDLFADNAIYKANEQFFTELNDTKINPEICRNYWEKEGYRFYCHLLSEAYVKVALYDIAPVLQKMGISYKIYHNDASLSEEYRASGRLPMLEMVLRDGHYFLLKTAGTQNLLDTYDEQHQVYKREREKSLARLGNNRPFYLRRVSESPTDKDIFALCPLLSVMHPNQRTVRKPIHNLVNLIKKMRIPITDTHEPIVDLKESNEDVELKGKEVLPDKPDEQQKDPISEERLPSSAFLVHKLVFQQHLASLKTKAEQFKKGSKKQRSARRLHDELDQALQIYIENQNLQSYKTFETICNVAMARERPILESDYNVKAILYNIGLAILGLGVIYAAAAGMYYLFTQRIGFFTTNELMVKHMNELQDALPKLNSGIQ